MKPSTDQLAELARLLAETREDELDCGAFLDRIAVYVETRERCDGGASPSEAEREVMDAIEHHMRICPPCLDQFRALRVALGFDGDAAEG